MEKIRQVVEELSNNMDCYDYPKYKILEKGVSRQLVNTVYELQAEYEDGTLYFKDADGLILDSNSMLIGVPEESIRDITFKGNNITLLLHNAKIEIELLK